MGRQMELRQLRALVAVVDEGGITRAARALGVSQSTASESLAALERVAGGALLARSSRGTAPTALGDSLLPFARQILALEKEALGQLADVTSHAAARLTIAASESLSAYLLPSQLGPLRRRWPRTRIQVATRSCHDVRAGVEAGRFDLGLLIDLPSRPRRGESIREIELALVVGPRNRLAGERVSLRQLRGAELLVSDVAGAYRDLARGPSKPKLEASLLAAGSLEGVKRGVLADDQAIGLLPLFAAAEELRSGRLCRVETTPSLPSMQLVALLPAGSGAPAPVRELVHRLREPPG